MAKDEMVRKVRKHHQFNGHEYEQTPGDSGGAWYAASLESQRVGHNLGTEQQLQLQHKQ